MKFLYQIILVGFLVSQAKAKTENWFVKSNEANQKIDRFLSEYTILNLDIQKTKAFYNSDSDRFILEVPMKSGSQMFEFTRNEIHAADFQILNAKGTNVLASIQLPVHYKSTTSARGRELVALSVFSNGEIALVISNSNGNTNISKLPDSLSTASQQYLLFNDKNLKIENPFHCELDSKTNEQLQSEKRNPKRTTIQDDTSCRLTEIYWECDHDMFQKGGNSIQGALNQFEAMFNGAAILYEIENINIGVKAVKVWDTPDPYNYNSSFTALDDFQAAGNAANWPGQLAHLLSTRPLSLGGVAYLNAICTSFRYGFSDIDFLFAPLPIYSWTLSTIAHELGHNFSSNHTHNCGWEFPNGEVHQIDSCWNAEGSCQPVIKGRVGTIMSYCHLTGSVNLSLGFGPLPGDRIREGYANMPCVSGTIVIPNYTPVNSGPFCDGDTLKLSAENLAGFSYSWTGPNGFVANTREPLIPNVTSTIGGYYALSVKKASCQSREKKTQAIFNCMQVGLTPIALCAGSSVSVPFKSTGVFNSGNQFVLQLSNSSGQFTNPVNLDTLISNSPQTVVTQLPSNIALGNGYKFRFISSNPIYTGLGGDKAFIINPIGPSPTPVDASRCGPGSVSLSVIGGSNLIWYPTNSELLPLAFGRRFDTPVLTQNASYFVQGGSTSKFFGGLNILPNTLFDSVSNGLIFDVISGFRLDSIRVRIRKNIAITTGNFTMQLVKSGVVLYSKSVSYSVQPAESDVLKIPLYWRLDPGDNYEISCLGTDFKLQKSTALFPLKIIGILAIKSQIEDPISNEYPYFFNWVIQRYSTCPSRRVEVKAKITNGVTPELPIITALSQDSLICNNPGNVFEWLINGQIYTNFGNKVVGLSNFDYKVRYKIDSCWSDWSELFHFTITASMGADGTSNVRLFPNPGSGQFFWIGPNEKTEIILFNNAGKQIWKRSVSKEDSFDISALAGGLYHVQWQTQSKAGVLRLIKQ